MNEENSIAEAMICDDGRIKAVGTTEEIIGMGQDGELIDLKGKDVLPGFIDSHIHLLDHALFEKKTALLGGAKSADEMVEITKKYISDNIKTWLESKCKYDQTITNRENIIKTWNELFIG